MYAIVETGGKQYRVAAGDVITVERLDADVGQEVAFDRVLVVRADGKVAVGNPVVPGARAVGTVLEHGRGKKIRGLKYKPKVNYRRRYGHRQGYTRVRIDNIQA